MNGQQNIKSGDTSFIWGYHFYVSYVLTISCASVTLVCMNIT